LSVCLLAGLSGFVGWFVCVRAGLSVFVLVCLCSCWFVCVRAGLCVCVSEPSLW
jgi:hypothetical protein